MQEGKVSALSPSHNHFELSERENRKGRKARDTRCFPSGGKLFN